MNWMFIPTLVVAFSLYVIGASIWNHPSSRVAKAALLLISLVLSTPALLFVLYYLHLFDNATWFYQFRSLPLSELSAGGIGLFAGLASPLILNGKRITRPFYLSMLALVIIGPYIKPIIAPLPSSRFHDRWTEGVCLQSTPSSCGAASAATLLRKSGINMREVEIARSCFTYLGGTENWYIARLFRSQGYDVRFIISHDPSVPIPIPSIAGVKVGGLGHFIPVIEETSTTYVTGDPLVGRQEWPKDKLRQNFTFTGFFMEIHKEAPITQSNGNR